MKANPGGQLDPSEVVGRDKLIAQLWEMLERLSVVLTAERRIGKTQMIKKMEAEPSGNVLTIYRDLEGVRTPLEFAEAVCQDVEAFLSGKDRIEGRLRRLVKHLADVEIGDVVRLPESLAPHWKDLLEKAIEDLVEHQERPIVFFWDEVPLMLHNIKNRVGEEAATEVLDVLRRLRQTHSGLRMVFTGSIGLHNVITAMQAGGYANEPINDMKIINVPPLAATDAQDLVLQLLDGEGIEVADRMETAQALAMEVDNVPFYIHHVVYDLKFHEGEINPASVEAAVRRRLTDPQDEWSMTHYRKRVDTYYSSEQGKLALAVLDVLAADGALGFADLFNRLKARIKLAEDEQESVREMLRLLQRDHYLSLDADGTYRFHFPLIRRWWQLHRG